jgi:hypothetical protein
LTEIAAASSAPAASAPPRWLAVACWLFAASAALCISAYLALTVQGSWFTEARTQHWTPRDLGVTRGSSQMREDGLALLAPDATGTTLVSVATSLRSSDYRVIAWETRGLPDDVEAALLWQSDYRPGRVFNRRLEVEAGRIAPFSLEREPNWVGRITGLALGLKGSYPQPIIVQGATAKTMSASEIIGERVGEWFKFEPWNGASINTIIGGADVQDLPMAFTFGVVIGLAALIYAALARWRPHWVGASGAFVVGAMFLAAWFALDVRWQWNLVRQVELTGHQYAGKTWHERHLAAEDKAVFAFIEKVRANLPPPPARVFMVADDHYFRDRGAYHLYPYNVYFDPWANTMPPVSAVRTGDFMVVYQRRGVQYDAATKHLRWEGGAPIAAELLFAESGGALFRIL